MAWYARSHDRRGSGDWSGGSRMRGYDRDWSDHEHTRFAPRGGFGGPPGRDLGDRLREGWKGLRQGVSRAIGHGPDPGYRGGRRGFGEGYRGSYSGYGRGYGRRYDGGWF